MKSPNTNPKKALQPIARVFKALAHPTRLVLLEALRQGPLSICELATLTARRQTDVSKHAHVLAQAGLISLTKRGTRVVCHWSRPLMPHLWKLAGLTALNEGSQESTSTGPFCPET